jgi:hypothetical protein
MTVTLTYQDNNIAPSFHNNHTRLSWLHTTTLAHDHVAMTTTLGCHGNHIPSYHSNQTRLTWRPCQVAIATTLVLHCDYMISQRCDGNCKSLLILIQCSNVPNNDPTDCRRKSKNLHQDSHRSHSQYTMLISSETHFKTSCRQKTLIQRSWRGICNYKY